MSDLLTAKQLADRMGFSLRKLETTLKQFGIKPDSRAGSVRLYSHEGIRAALESERICHIGAIQNSRIRLFSAVEKFSRLASSLGTASGKINALEARELSQAVKAIGSVPQGEKRTRTALVSWNARYNAKAETAISLMNRIAANL
jgi:hypothetical protein